MIVKRGKHAYQYQSSRVKGDVKTVYQGKVSTQELHEHEQRKEETQQHRQREHELAQLQQAVHPALPLSGMIGAHCVSDDTELLTKDGWRGIDEVTVGTEFATFNPDTREIEYQPATKLFVYDYDGEMYHMSNTAADHLVTPHHKMLYYTEDGYPKEVLAEDFFVMGARLPVSGLVNRQDLDMYSDDEVRLLTWCVTDGHLNYIRKDGTYNYEFGFTKQRKIERLQALLDRMEVAYARSALSNGVTKFYVNHLSPKFTKQLNDYHRSFSPRQVTILLEEWSHTDGSRADRRSPGCFTLFTNSDLHRDIIQELAALSGHKTTVTTNVQVHSIGVRLNTFQVRCDGINKGVVDYTGRVWCPEVAPHHTVIARRNGKVFISYQSNEQEWSEFRSTKLTRRSSTVFTWSECPTACVWTKRCTSTRSCCVRAISTVRRVPTRPCVFLQPGAWRLAMLSLRTPTSGRR
jgi:hypothetical protein